MSPISPSAQPPEAGPPVSSRLFVPGTVLPRSSCSTTLAVLPATVAPTAPVSGGPARPRLFFGFIIALCTRGPHNAEPVKTYYKIRITLRCPVFVSDAVAQERLERDLSILKRVMRHKASVIVALGGLRVEKMVRDEGDRWSVELEGEGERRLWVRLPGDKEGQRKVLVLCKEEEAAARAILGPSHTPDWARPSSDPDPAVPARSAGAGDINKSHESKPPIATGPQLPDRSAHEPVDTGLRPLTSLYIPPRPAGPSEPGRTRSDESAGRAGCSPTKRTGGLPLTSRSSDGQMTGAAGLLKRPRPMSMDRDDFASREIARTLASVRGQADQADTASASNRARMATTEEGDGSSSAHHRRLSAMASSSAHYSTASEQRRASSDRAQERTPSLSPPRRIASTHTQRTPGSAAATQGIPMPPAGQGHRPATVPLAPTPSGLSARQQEETPEEARVRKRAEATDRALERRAAEARAAEGARQSLIHSADELKEGLIVSRASLLPPVRWHGASDAAPGAGAGTSTELHYTPLGQARPGETVNVIGVVVDCKPTRTSKDYHRDYILTDPALFGGDTMTSDDFVCTVFRRRREELPELERGTVVLLQRVKVNVWNDKPKGQLYSSAGTVLAHMKPYPSEEVVHTVEASNPARYDLVPAEVQRMVRVRDWWAALHGGHRGASAKKERRTSGPASMDNVYNWHGKHAECRLEDIGVNGFFDFVFKIMHVFRNTEPDVDPQHPKAKLELYVTDGTKCMLPTRNFHNINAAQWNLPPEALVCVTIYDEPSPHELPYYHVGNILDLRNVRSKTHGEALELAWSELVMQAQHNQGFKPKRVRLLSEDDPRARDINHRLKDWRNGRAPRSSAAALTGAAAKTSSHAPPAPQDPFVAAAAPSARGVNSMYSIPAVDRHVGSATTVARAHAPTSTTTTGRTGGYIHRSRPDAPLAPAPAPEAPAAAGRSAPAAPLSTFLYTTHTDPISHPVSSMSEVLQNRTVPNKFRLRARVKGVVPRVGKAISVNADGQTAVGPADKEGLVSRWCGKCRRTVTTDYCKSCNDTSGHYAEWIWRFLIVLENEREGVQTARSSAEERVEAPGLPVLVCDEEAAKFLPPLPPCSTSTNPSDRRKTARQIQQAADDALRLLLGRAMDGVREQPVVDWSVCSYCLDVGGRRRNGGLAAATAAVAVEDDDKERDKGDRVVAWRVFGMESKGLGREIAS